MDRVRPEGGATIAVAEAEELDFQRPAKIPPRTLPVSVGLRRTLDVLRESPNLAADELLVDLAVLGPDGVRELALDAVLKRAHRDALVQLVARYHLLSGSMQERVRRAGGILSHAIRQSYLSDDEQVYANACALIRDLPAYDQIALVLSSLEQNTARRPQVASLVARLAERLAEEIESEPQARSCADIEVVRRQFLASLEVSLRRYPRHRTAAVVEAVLRVSEPSSAVVRDVLADAGRPCHSPMVDALRTSRDLRVARWLFDLLGSNHPPASVLHVVSQRKDDWFVGELLSRTRLLADPAVQASFRQIKEFAWLRPDASSLGRLNPEQQKAAVILAANSGMSLAEKLATVEFILREGGAEARRAAACTLADFPGADAARLVVECLEDRDPLVQLAAVQQIRVRGLPNGLALLTAKLDHSDERVREAAQRGLGDYNFERFVRTFDQMDQRSRFHLGSLIARIDPETDSKIREQLRAPHRNQRIRAMKIVAALDRVDDFSSELLALVEDSDHLVRRSAIELLESTRDAELIERLRMRAKYGPDAAAGCEEALRFLSQRAHDAGVRDAAREALASVPSV